jgi:hypothetical protein
VVVDGTAREVAGWNGLYDAAEVGVTVVVDRVKVT